MPLPPLPPLALLPCTPLRACVSACFFPTVPSPPLPPLPDITYEPALTSAVLRAYEALLTRPGQVGILAATRRGDAPWAVLTAGLAACPLAVADVSAAVRAAVGDGWAYVGVDVTAVHVFRLTQRT